MQYVHPLLKFAHLHCGKVGNKGKNRTLICTWSRDICYDLLKTAMEVTKQKLRDDVNYVRVF